MEMVGQARGAVYRLADITPASWTTKPDGTAVTSADPGSFGEGLGIDELDPPPGHLQPPAVLGLAEDLVRRGPGGAGELRDVFLRERDDRSWVDAVPQFGGAEEAAPRPGWVAPGKGRDAEESPGSDGGNQAVSPSEVSTRTANLPLATKW